MVAEMLLTLVTVAVQSPATDSLRLLAVRLPESSLVLEVRDRPLAVRDAIAESLRRGELDAASKIAGAYAVAWQDSFLVREVERFAAWPQERQSAKLWTDSVRRAGITAFGRDGPTAAVVMWRRGLRRAVANHDSAGMAALLGNIGAGLLEEGRLDSASRYLERSRALSSAIGDLRVEANATGALAGLREERGDLAGARNGYAAALALRTRIGDTRGAAADYNNLGLLAQRLGDLDEARRQFEAALALNQRDGRDEVAATNLLNLAGLASLAGDFARAEGLYRDALATWRSREQWADAADALYGLGQLQLRRGDYPAAQVALREALDIYRQTGPISDELAVRRDLARALSAAGELQGARDELTRAQRRADSTRAPAGARAGIALTRADLAVQLNALAEAQRLYTRAEILYRQAGDLGGEAEAQHGRGLLLLEQNDPAAAQALLAATLRTQVGAGDQRSAALTRLSLGEATWARGDTTAARRQLVRAAADLERLGDPVAAATAIGERAALEAGAGSAAAAESLYQGALARLDGRVAPEAAWRLHAGLATALRARGAVDDAARELRAALVEIERPSRSLTLAERRSGFLADKWEAYAQLALIEHARGRPGAAFEVSERLRAREMLELLARGRVSEPGDTAADLVGREQDLRHRLAELTRVSDGPGGEARRELDLSAAPSDGALRDAQDAYADVLLEIRERAPRHAALVAPATATWRDVAQQLEVDEAFIEYLVSDSGSLAFVVTRDTIATIVLSSTRHELARLIEFTRGTIERRGTAGTDSLWRGPLRLLDARLVEPIEDARLLNGKNVLIVVPHLELHYIPFAALLGEGRRFLVERYQLMTTPSASVWLSLKQRARRGPTDSVLAFAPEPAGLPASRAEVAAIRRLSVPGVRVVSGAAATEAAFGRDAPSQRVLHLATYGVLNKQNPLFSFVSLAPDDAENGRLEVHEVLGLHLTADLVVLSACQTGLGSGTLADVPPGDDWVGLTRAFLHAGARRVVATLWPVDDWATAALMERFYGDSAPASEPSRALAMAQRALLAAPTTAHPFYWAGFVAVGAN